MANAPTKEVTKTATCPTHGQVEAVKEVPVFKAPGLFYVFRKGGSSFQSYKCPTCGSSVK